MRRPLVFHRVLAEVNLSCSNPSPHKLPSLALPCRALVGIPRREGDRGLQPLVLAPFAASCSEKLRAPVSYCAIAFFHLFLKFILQVLCLSDGCGLAGAGVCDGAVPAPCGAIGTVRRWPRCAVGYRCGTSDKFKEAQVGQALRWVCWSPPVLSGLRTHPSSWEDICISL